jgi:hypothetical protein
MGNPEMRATFLLFCCCAAVLVVGCRRSAETAPPASDGASVREYAPISIAAVDEPGTPRIVRCQVGDESEQICTFTPLFNNDSFQLDGEGVALRMVVTEDEGALFEIISSDYRVPLRGAYRRSSPIDPCWTAESGSSSPSPICVRSSGQSEQ